MNDFDFIRLISFDEIRVRYINISDSDLKKWLRSKNIVFQKLSKSLFVNEVDIVIELTKQVAKRLRFSYPSTWKEMLKYISQNESICNVVLIQLGEDTEKLYPKRNRKISIKNKGEEKLFRELNSLSSDNPLDKIILN
jgi:hypothetical protein